MEEQNHVFYKTIYTSHQLDWKYTDQFPHLDTYTSTYEHNFWTQYRGRVETFMTLTATEQDTSAVLLWKQGTPKARLGDAFQHIYLTEKSRI